MDAICPTVDGDGETDGSAEFVSGDFEGTFQQKRVVERPDIRADSDAQVEQLLADDGVVGDHDSRVAACVFAIDEIDGAETKIVVRGRDGVVGDDASRRPKDHDAAVGTAGDDVVLDQRIGAVERDSVCPQAIAIRIGP